MGIKRIPHQICRKGTGEGYFFILFNMFNHSNQSCFVVELGILYNYIKQGFESFTDFVSLKTVFNKVIS